MAVGTDKKKCPSIVEKFAAKTGARIICPQEDISIREKLAITSGKDYKNDHERDALASALFALKELAPLIGRIKKKNRGDTYQQNKIMRLVILKGININAAIELLEEKEEKTKILPASPEIEPKISESPEAVQIKNLEKTNLILRKHNLKLLKALNRIKAKYRKIQLSRMSPKTTIETETLWTQIRTAKEKMELLEEQLKNTNLLLSNLKGKIILKKLDNLSWEEYVRKNKLLNITEGDILLIENPNIYEGKTVEQLKKTATTIIYKNQIIDRKSLDGFSLIPASRLQISETKNFAVTNKESLDSERAKSNIIHNIINDYRKERRFK